MRVIIIKMRGLFTKIITFYTLMLPVLVMAADFMPWALVDTQAETITVFGEQGPVAVFDNIALGVRGAGIKLRRGDEITPKGQFTVGWFNRASRFDLFIGLNYPNEEHAALAHYDGRINTATYRRIQRALTAGRRPPQDTPLGGYIGLHGVGKGDPLIHENFNWTNGCVALNNQQIRRLADWLKVGSKVEIR